MVHIFVKKHCYLIQEFGKIKKVNVLKKRGTEENRGLAFITYHSAHHAAIAVENAPDGNYEYVLTYCLLIVNLYLY